MAALNDKERAFVRGLVSMSKALPAEQLTCETIRLLVKQHIGGDQVVEDVLRFMAERAAQVWETRAKSTSPFDVPQLLHPSVFQLLWESAPSDREKTLALMGACVALAQVLHAYPPLREQWEAEAHAVTAMDALTAQERTTVPLLFNEVTTSN